ncbi:MAG: hypothetical protein JXB88_25935 [Spirochaetales bacterium]|nr:hypothetical protein [Spirochaetales bacterium]
MARKILLSFACLLFTVLFLNTSCFKTSALKPVPGTGQEELTVPAPSPQQGIETVSSSAAGASDESPALLHPDALTDKTRVADWVQNNFTRYYQKYNLSCEAALIRLICGIWGISDMSEDDILDLMPRHPANPGLGLVMENIHGDVFLPDGTINWANYGAHSPVVKKTLETILESRHLHTLYYIEQKRLDNKQLAGFLKKEPACLGAVIWVAAYIDKKKPPVNEIGQVLGEHVQYVSPVLDKGGRMLVYDVWPWENQPFHLSVPFNRDLFDYDTLLIMKKK